MRWYIMLYIPISIMLKKCNDSFMDNVNHYPLEHAMINKCSFLGSRGWRTKGTGEILIRISYTCVCENIICTVYTPMLVYSV